MVRDSCEPGPGTYVMGHGDPNRLVHEQPELSEQPLGLGVIHIHSECEGTATCHGLFFSTLEGIRGSRGELAETIVIETVDYLRYA